MDDDEVINVKDLVKRFQKRVRDDYDAVIAVTGEEGSGKSVLANNLIEEYLKTYCNTREELLEEFKKYIIFSPNKETVKETIEKAPRYSILNADEAMKILYKQNWASYVQRWLNMLYAVARQENKISVLCIPRFVDLNEYFRNHRVKYWIHVLDRGTAVFSIRDWSPYNDDPWLIKENNKKLKKMGYRKKFFEFTKEDKINFFKKLPTYVGVIQFNDMDSDLKKVYKQYKKQYKYSDMEEQMKNTDGGKMTQWYIDKMRNLAYNLRHKAGWRVKEIENFIGVGHTTISEWTYQAQPQKEQQEKEAHSQSSSQNENSMNKKKNSENG